MEAVTISGWYQNDDGTWQYHWWHQGQLKSGSAIFTSLLAAKITRSLAELESIGRNTPGDLAALGYNAPDLSAAIRAGVIREIGIDRIETTGPWR